jgi:hypothetical protein
MVQALKWLAKAAGIGVVWVYILSINMNGEPVFRPLSDFFVHNKLISSIDEGLGNFAHRVNTAIKLAWSDSPKAARQHLE